LSRRIPRVNQLIKKELGQLLLKEFSFPGNVLVTITRVETSVDLSQARVYISVIPKDKVQNVLEILEKLIYYLQQKLNKRLKMRPIPRIRFVEEKKTSEAERIEELLEEIKAANSKLSPATSFVHPPQISKKIGRDF